MKMVKKILLGLVACTTIASFVSYGLREEAGNAGMIKVNAGSKKASIDYTNENNTVTRGFKTLQTQHLDAICHIETTVNELAKKKDADGNVAVANGTMGYIFNVVKDDNDKYSFTIAGVRYNQDLGNIQAYVETFKGIDKNELEDELTGGKPATGSPNYGRNFGFQLISKTDVDSVLDAQTTSPKKLEIWIDVVANGTVKDGNSMKTPTGRNGTPGTYTVSFYYEDPHRNSSATSYDLTYGENKDKTATTADGYIHSYTIESSEVNTTFPTVPIQLTHIEFFGIKQFFTSLNPFLVNVLLVS